MSDALADLINPNPKPIDVRLINPKPARSVLEIIAQARPGQNAFVLPVAAASVRVLMTFNLFFEVTAISPDGRVRYDHRQTEPST